MELHRIRELIQQVERFRGKRSQILKDLKIPRSTYYGWRTRYRHHGIVGLTNQRRVPQRIWNRLLPEEQERIIAIAKVHPELSARLLAVKITDEEDFTVSESTVFRILKEQHLIAPRPLAELPAAKAWRQKTTRPDELWQCDATSLFVVGWGYYKLIPVEDDYSRKILGYDLRPDETAFTLADVVELAIEQARREGHIMDRMPRLYSDNGPGFVSQVMDDYLTAHGIRHIFGTPYHPQGRGKIERFNRRIKEQLCLVVYCAPDELKRAITESITAYNQTPHEALENVSPNDVYAGRKEEILNRRFEKKQLTKKRRMRYNLTATKYHLNQGQSVS